MTFSTYDSFLKNGPTPASFSLFSSFQTHITIFTTHECEKMSIQYTVPGFELTTLEHETPPKTTRSGLLSITVFFVLFPTVYLFPSMLSFCANSFDSVLSIFIMSVSQKSLRVSVSRSLSFSSNHIFSFLLLHTQPSFRGRPHQTKNFLDLLNFSLCHCQSKLK